jgi:hypothetical protein
VAPIPRVRVAVIPRWGLGRGVEKQKAGPLIYAQHHCITLAVGNIQILARTYNRESSMRRGGKILLGKIAVTWRKSRS